MIISAIIFALVLGTFLFCILPHAGLARRTLSAGLFVALIAVVYGGGVDLLSRPKPLRLEWRDATKAEVLSAVLNEDNGIYVWLTVPGLPEPRAYALPWNVDMAQQLQTALSNAEATGAAVQMLLPTELGLDDRDPMFYAMPQPPLPAKDYQSADPMIYQRSDQPS
jgi:hypothetical protein